MKTETLCDQILFHTKKSLEYIKYIDTEEYMSDRSYEILLYKLTANIISKIIELNGWDEDLALERFTKLKIYEYLEKEETKI